MQRMIDKLGGTQQLHFDDEDDDDDKDDDEPVGGKDRESTVDGFAGEHVLFLLIADQKSTLVISYWRHYQLWSVITKTVL